MTNNKPEIPYGAYWSTPYFKWQGKIQNLHSMKFAAWVAKRELEKRDISLEVFDHGIFGYTVPQMQSFYGMPWLASEIGAPHLTGQTISQACATGARCLLAAEQEINAGVASTVLVVTADRCSNGPHVYYPAPSGPGGTGRHEDWVLDNFSNEPVGKHAMLNTAENVVKKHNISTAEQHEVVLQRTAQYQMATADNYAFQKRYMSLPFDIPDPRFKKVVDSADGDEGVVLSTEEGLAKLKPVLPDGTVTFGGQTHPADGNSALIFATSEKAQALSKDSGIKISVLGWGQSRCQLAHMPEAPIPAAKAALQQAGLEIKDIDAFKTHNPFAVNDIVFAKQTGAPLEKMNNYGSSLIWGHPQGPTGLRSVIELIEELVINGGGTGLFVGCAAGDSSMGLVVRVEDR